MTLFVDMDDVLADTYGKHLELYNMEHKKTMTMMLIESGEFWENVPLEHQLSVHQHVHTEGFFRSLDPIPDSIEVMRELCDRHEVYIATAATQFPNSLREKSDWLDEFFPFITWEHRIFCGHKFVLHGDLLIDDRAYNLEKFNGDTLLFSSPHNVYVKGFDRVDSWREVAERLL